MNQDQLPLYVPDTVVTVGSHTAKIVKYLASGGYAQVYSAYVTPVDYSPATNIACLKRVVVPDKKSLNALRAEVDALKVLRNKKYVVSYIDSHASKHSGHTGSYEVFVLMEYCSGGSLIDFLNTRLKNRLREQEILHIMTQVAVGVAQMHELQPSLIHRDIKIENILISENGEYKVCDFGSVCGVIRPPRSYEEMKYIQHDIMKNTTAQYRSPEMLDLTKGYQINEKSDIWALGVFLFKLCYYTTPFEKEGEKAILKSQFQYPAYPVYSDSLKNVIRVLLSVDPFKRPNICQLIEELSRLQGIVPPMKNFYLSRALETSSLMQPLQNNSYKVPISDIQDKHKRQIPNIQSSPEKLPSIQSTSNGMTTNKILTRQTSPDIENLKSKSSSNYYKSGKNYGSEAITSGSIEKDSQFNNSNLYSEKPNLYYRSKDQLDTSNRENSTINDVPGQIEKYGDWSSVYRKTRNSTLHIGRSRSSSLDSTSSSSLSVESYTAEPLSKNSTGISLVRTLSKKLKNVITGEKRSVSPVRSRQNTGGSSRSVFTVLHEGFTGGNSRISSSEHTIRGPSSSSHKSRVSSSTKNFEEGFIRKHVDIVEESAEPKVGIKLKTTREAKDSIKRRVRELLLVSEDEQYHRTASGYGKYTDVQEIVTNIMTPLVKSTQKTPIDSKNSSPRKKPILPAKPLHLRSQPKQQTAILAGSKVGI
ncbi:hypothetical protein Kpol_1039p33 [Vanderwaltozyma polyspora DSM 70294]|uniref:non-specific serine/threonine protein kinase n=1 Tax=Vanderwaltozyma polyspora (strain ATCC 22028 / DSM 70294 / BCRC 21397 / CBS 2163 / NBRC 10782 / NRRL Y-8283 / UCD 57-17) TaxID=436907 RepID=A7THG0_VANPO|nr:uncharacterized protein Kpol_1039p33 [Vanderwaltozyma polyspora DSM 70294]EDO18284.1 hypothetical protein Kpol_1039p33 [Vanderwaltozyma polyspora DSM 70294]